MKKGEIESITLTHKTENYKTLIQLNGIQWFLVLIYAILFVIFVTRPALFLVQGFAIDVKPNTPFLGLNYVIPFSKYFFFFVTMIYLVYQFYGVIGRFIYLIFGLFAISTSIAINILMAVNYASINNVNHPNNPGNSDLYCCKYGLAVPECQTVGPPADCGMAPSTISLRANAMFVEYWIWVGIFLLFEIAIIGFQWFFMDTVEKVNSEKIIYSKYQKEHDNSSSSTIQYKIYGDNNPLHYSGKLNSSFVNGKMSKGLVRDDNHNGIEGMDKEFHITKNKNQNYNNSNYLIHDILKLGCNTLLKVGSHLSNKYLFNQNYNGVTRRKKREE